MGAKLIGWKKKKGPTDKQLVHVHNIWMREDGNKPREPRRCATQSLDRLSGNKLSLRLIKRMKHVNHTCQNTSVWAGPRPDTMSPSSNSRSSLIATRFHRPIQTWFKSSLVGSLNILLISFFFCIVQTNRWWQGYPIEFAVWRAVSVWLCAVCAPFLLSTLRWMSACADVGFQEPKTQTFWQTLLHVLPGIRSSPLHMDTLKRPGLARERTRAAERTFSCVLDAVKYAQRPRRHNAKKHGLI